MRVVLVLVLAYGLRAQVAVISHRGEHLHHRENTMAAFDAAYEAKADYVEVDIRTTLDGKLMLMHDSTAERTTGVKEEIAKMTSERLRGLGVPTFDEALAFAETRMGIYMDCKQAKAEDLVDLVRAHHMEKDVLVYCGPRLCKEIQQLEPKMTLMPEARDAVTARSLIQDLGVKALAFDANDFKDDVIAVAKEAHVRIYVDRLGPADNPAGWQDAIDRGAAGIQTDHPAELANYLTRLRAR